MDSNASVDPAFLADLERSRAKHPGIAKMFDGLLGEIHELKRAYAGDGDVRAEALDVAVCAYRIATEGDQGSNEKIGLVPDDFAWGAKVPGQVSGAAWMPIETAPTSGAEILLWWRNAGACTGGFRIDEDWDPSKPTPEAGWAGEGDDGIPCNQEDCTHWMLLPDAPFGHRYPNFAGHRARQEILKDIFASIAQHPDDTAVDRFASAMKAKMARARAKGRGGWEDRSRCSDELLATMLVGHLLKGNEGNFEDIGNLAMMLHQRQALPSLLARIARERGLHPQAHPVDKGVASTEVS